MTPECPSLPPPLRRPSLAWPLEPRFVRCAPTPAISLTSTKLPSARGARWSWKTGSPGPAAAAKMAALTASRSATRLNSASPIVSSFPFYVADWTYVNDPKNHQHGARFQDAALEAIYQLSDPANDPIGSARYGAGRGGDRFAELEDKLILEKGVGPWNFAYNATLEAKWEGEGLREKEGEFSQALGISRRFDHHFYAGAELEHEVGLPNWNRAAHSVVSAGPNAG